MLLYIHPEYLNLGSNKDCFYLIHDWVSSFRYICNLPGKVNPQIDNDIPLWVSWQDFYLLLYLLDVRTYTFRLKRNSTNNSFLDPFHELYINKLSEVYSYLFHLKVGRGEAELICRRQYFWVLYWLTLWMCPSKPLPGYTIVMAYTTYRTIEYKA